MPASSHKQRNFMHVVHAMQKGKMPKSGKAGEAASTMNPEDVKDFLMQECGFGECAMESKVRILKALKEIQEPMNLQEKEDEADPNVVAGAKTFNGDYKKTLGMYRGYEMTPKENQAIQGFDEAEPTLHDKFKVGYSKSDEYGNTSTILVKKLRQPDGKFVYMAIVKSRSGQEEPEPEPEAPPTTSAPPTTPTQTSQPPLKEAEEGGDEITIVKSVPMDDQEGSEILTNFLGAVFHKHA